MKISELKKLAEKHLDYDYDVETLKQYCSLEPQEIEYIEMTNPKNILALIEDRERLRNSLEQCIAWSEDWLGGREKKDCLDIIKIECQITLKKSDELEG